MIATYFEAQGPGTATLTISYGGSTCAENNYS